jgi:hypothetical protein
LATFDDGTVLLNLQTGSFYRLNKTAAHVCASLARGSSVAMAAQHLARDFGLPADMGTREVADVLSELERSAAPTDRNPISFAPAPDGDILSWNGHPLWHVATDAQRLTYQGSDAGHSLDPVTQLLWVAPHILIVRGAMVLHAAAVQVGEDVVAFAGPSGRGKTTLAHVLAENGFPLLGEDLLVLDLATDRPHVVRDGERRIRDWARAEAPHLGEQSPVALTSLEQALAGKRQPVGRILFPRREVMARPELKQTILGGAAALLLLLANSFAEMRRRELWRRIWEAQRLLAGAVPVGWLDVPDGLDALRRGVTNYNWKVQS